MFIVSKKPRRCVASDVINSASWLLVNDKICLLSAMSAFNRSTSLYSSFVAANSRTANNKPKTPMDCDLSNLKTSISKIIQIDVNTKFSKN